MKTLTEQIEWHKEFENRKWKRIVSFTELSLIALAGAIIIIVVLAYGNGGNFQPAYILFLSVFTISTVCIAPAVYQVGKLTRWQTKLVCLGFGCGMGISALAGFLILEVQHLNT